MNTSLLQSWERRLLGALARIPAPRMLAGLVLLFSMWIVADVFFLSVTGGLAQSTYDTMVRYRLYAPPPDERIVIVDIDESTLARMAPEFGRWPWPRDTLATVLDHIESQQPAAILWDIVFSDADRLSPGGDLAFDQAVARSRHSHFGVVRLPRKNDDKSQLTQAHLPNLWAQPASDAQATHPTLALVPPVLPSVVRQPLGFNNGYVDKDGVLRRYRYFEKLSDGSIIQSLPMTVVRSLEPDAYARWLAHFKAGGQQANSETSTEDDVMVNWRHRANVYPRTNFADVFEQAEGGKPKVAVPSLAGKIVIIGATAPSLHDSHPTPLSATQAGVESLATGLDNALHERHMRELPKWVGALLAVLLCAAVALWSHYRSVSSLGPAMVAVPGVLVAISYASLHRSDVYLDLHLSAGLTLVFLAVLRVWHKLRKRHWCGDLVLGAGPLAVWAWCFDKAWSDDQLDRLIDVLQTQAPDTRVLLLDPASASAGSLRWHPFATCWALVGPLDQMRQAQMTLLHSQRDTEPRHAPMLVVPSGASAAAVRSQVASLALQGWSALQQSSSKELIS